jgi:hypothetical protein
MVIGEDVPSLFVKVENRWAVSSILCSGFEVFRIWAHQSQSVASSSRYGAAASGVGAGSAEAAAESEQGVFNLIFSLTGSSFSIKTPSDG